MNLEHLSESELEALLLESATKLHAAVTERQRRSASLPVAPTDAPWQVKAGHTVLTTIAAAAKRKPIYAAGAASMIVIWLGSQIVRLFQVFQ